ncbi:MAG: PAS domain S-box protein [Chitinispirillaceae bacterium]
MEQTSGNISEIEYLKHQNRVLRAVRDVNRLILRENERSRLMNGICAILAQVPECGNAFIVLLQDGKPAEYYYCGFEDEFASMADALKGDTLPKCMQKELNQEKTVVCNGKECPDCPLVYSYAGHSGCISRLQCEGETYGWIGISVPEEYVSRDEVVGIFSQLADDIGHALWAKVGKPDCRNVEGRYEAILNCTSDAVIEADSDGRIRLFNPGAERITGYCSEEVVGQPLSILCPKELVNEQNEMLHRVLDEQTLQNYEAKRLRADGQLMDVDVTADVVKDRRGQLQGIIIVARDITDRKKMEASLRENEMCLRQIYENMEVGVAQVSLESRFIAANEAYCRMLGYEECELIGMHISQITHPDFLEKNIELQSQLTEGKKDHYRLEKKYIRKDGQVVYGILDANLIRDSEGKPLYGFCSSVDITKRREAEDEKNKALEVATFRTKEMETLFRGAKLVLEESSFETAARKVFDSAREMTGARVGYIGVPDEKSGEKKALFLETDGVPHCKEPQFPQPILDLQSEVYETGQALYQNDFRWADCLPGGCIHLRNVLFAPMVVNNEVLGVIGLANKKGDFDENDKRITEALGNLAALSLKNSRSVKELRESQTSLRYLFNNMSSGVVVYEQVENGRDFRIFDFNPTGLKRAGLRREEVIGKYLSEAFPGVIGTKMTDLLRKAHMSGEPQYLPLTEYKHECHHFWIESRIFRLPSGRLVALFEDKTEQIRMERRLRQSEKMEALGQLAGGIAHDFNNIMSAIIGFAELGLDDVSDGSRLQKNLNQILSAGERARRLVKQILSFSIQRGDLKKPQLICSVVNEAVELFRGTAPRSLDVQCRITGDTLPVLADATRIHEAVVNLCFNAAYAVGQNGRIEITCEERSIDSQLEGRIGPIDPGMYSVIEVKDDGCGMSEVVMSRIFEPFYTTKKVGEGSGMGLAVVFGVVKGHDGNITVNSIPGQGTSFKIFLPKTQQNVEPKQIRSDRVRGGNESVLFVDDEEVLCDMAEMALGSLGYKVTTCCDGKQALQAFREDPFAFDIVLTDHSMPGMSGVELCTELIRIRRDVPIILCTGYRKDFEEKSAFEPGIRAICIKPFRKKEIDSKIRMVLDRDSI